MSHASRLTRLLFAAVVLVITSHVAVAAEADETFAPVGKLLVRRCLECHNAGQAAGELVLETRDRLLKGGESGEVVKPGDVDGSLLLDRVVAGEMPPEEKGKSRKLSAAEIELLRDWIKSGAKWPQDRRLDVYELTTDKRGGRDWWSLQPVKKPKPPRVDGDWPRNAIDAFVYARLRGKEMTPAPEADRRTLIRRLYFDVVGLPPTVEEVEAFAADESAGAYEQLVDRLLASPHYGERWGRYWLDLVRYAETCGYERDQVKPGVWKYRDWVIDALNKDLPYDQFIVAQLAGDELPDRDEQSVIATGFLRLGTWNDEPNDPQEYKYERLEDMVHATSTAFLGLTVKCARCHDHKFDPIPQLDYYRMASAFWAGYIEPGDRKLLGGPSKERLGFDVFGWTDRARDPPQLRLLIKGNPKNPGQEVPFQHLTMFTSLTVPAESADENSATSQRRLQLARWIARPDNPLTARVLVNRLWQHHFGQALVRTPNNFGYKGALPTHPLLLDWLAAEFTNPTLLAEGQDASAKAWTMKRLHKLMLMSATYRQSANHPKHDQYSERDFGNHSLWRAARRRLDAEAMRDRMLSVSGQLDVKLGGASFRPTIHPEALEGLSRKSSAWQASPEPEQRRRSVYIFTKRGLLPPLMTTFDFNDTTLPCGKRDVTTVAPQALALLNNQFVHKQSQALAQRVLDVAGKKGSAAQVEAAWRFALARRPTESEARAAAQHLLDQKTAFAARDKQLATASVDAKGELPIRKELVLHLRADRGVALDGTSVSLWHDQSGKNHHARQPDAKHRPQFVKRAIGAKPSIRFDGNARYLHVEGQVLTSQQCTIVAVATDRGSGSHREIFSNWDGSARNSVTSIFLGTTGANTIRFSDHLVKGNIRNKEQPFALTAVAGPNEAIVFQNANAIAKQASRLPERNLKTAYVVGQQGNIQGEYWNGDIAELIVFDRAIAGEERRRIWSYLAERYELTFTKEAVKSAELLALESLCHVLLNSNEFLYVD